MIIFTTAMGINAAGVAATKSPEQRQYEQRGLNEDKAKTFFHDWFSSVAFEDRSGPKKLNTLISG